jgi:alpha-ketoglutarate-dependent taurine dioxygenase
MGINVGDFVIRAVDIHFTSLNPAIAAFKIIGTAANMGSRPIWVAPLSALSGLRSLDRIDETSLRDLPPPGVHPLVQRHPENHRPALYLNPVRIEAIVGMEDRDALALVEELMAHATQRKYEYRHQWRPGDMVIWDNRSVMHQANPDYDMAERRYLYRLMLRGTAPIAA